MRAWTLLAIFGGAACAGIVVAAVVRSPAQAVLPPGYVSVPGPIPLNPAHVGAVGSQFPSQDCASVPPQFQPGPGEVTWHFILPQSVVDRTPTNIFDTLSVRFLSAGVVTFGSAVTDFGPPSSAHAFAVTPTDDKLEAGTATIGRDVNASSTRGNDSQFNLSHTCVGPTLPTTTTSTTTAATTTPTTTTTSGSSTTTGPTTTAATGTSTSSPSATTTGTTAAVGPATSSQSSAEPTTASPLPHTGRNDGTATNVALFALVVGFALLVAARLRTSASGE